MSHSGKSEEKKSLCESDVDGIMISTCEPYIEETKCVFVPEERATVKKTLVKVCIVILYKKRKKKLIYHETFSFDCNTKKYTSQLECNSS
jgi:hypothetical protein